MRLKNYLNEGEGELAKEKRIMFQWKGHKIVNTMHGKERMQQRNSLNDFELIKLFQSAIQKVISKSVKIGEKVVFWSKKLGQAFLAELDDVKDLELITFYPRHDKPSLKSHPFQRTVVVEEKEIRIIELD